MTREEQDQALAELGFKSLPMAVVGWRKEVLTSRWDLCVYILYGSYLAATNPRQIDLEVMFDDPISAAAYLLIQAADQP